MNIIKFNVSTRKYEGSEFTEGMIVLMKIDEGGRTTTLVTFLSMMITQENIFNCHFVSICVVLDLTKIHK